jgi:tetratricopeptide (TPR) repeat protein
LGDSVADSTAPSTARDSVQEAVATLTGSNDIELVEKTFDLLTAQSPDTITPGLVKKLLANAACFDVLCRHAWAGRLVSDAAMMVVRVLERNDREKATELIKLVIDRDPGRADLHLTAAEQLWELGRGDEAYDHFAKAGGVEQFASIHSDPKKVQSIIRSLASSGHLRDAQELLGRLLEQMAEAVTPALIKSIGGHRNLISEVLLKAEAERLSVDATMVLIRALEGHGQGDKAIELSRQLLKRVPDNVDVRRVFGDQLAAMNDLAGARDVLLAALEMSPSNMHVLRSLAKVENTARDFAAAEGHLRAAFAAAPQDLGCILDLASCLLRQAHFHEAADVLRNALSQTPDDASLHSQLGNTLRFQGANREAEIHLRRAIELDPQNAMAMINLAMIHEEEGDFEPAVVLHQRAASLKGGSYNATIFCHSLLAAGRSGSEAWGTNMHRVEYSAFCRLPGIRPWRGESLQGKSIFVLTEGGAGDQVRDACCFHELAQHAKDVTVTIEPRFMTLFERSFPTIRFVPMPRDLERVAPYERMLSRLIDEAAFKDMQAHDYAVISPDLFCYFRDRKDQWGRNQPYLTPSPELVAKWKEKLAVLGPGPRFGMSWRSVPNYNRLSFHTDLVEWDPVFTLPGAHFFNLQYDDCEDELRAAEEKFSVRIHRWPDLDLRNDFENIAGLVANLDVVMAPNTAILEFTGALGVRGWYLNRVPVSYDYWRMKDPSGADLLYQSVCQIRGVRPHDTPALMEAVSAKIKTTFG